MTIEWSKVEAAMEHSMHGRANQADQALCVAAYKAEPKAYGELQRKVRERAHRSMNPLSPKEEDET